jgi:hypothetical protein
MLASFVTTNIVFNTIPYIVNSSINTFKSLFTYKQVITDDDLRERLLSLDLDNKLLMYKSLIEDLDSCHCCSNSVKVASEAVQNSIIKVNEMLNTLDNNLLKQNNPNNFYYVSKLWFLESESNEKLVNILVLYTKILDKRFDFLMQLLKIERGLYGVNILKNNV